METFKLFFERAIGLIEVVNFKELGPVDAKVDSGNGAFNVLHGTDLQEYGDTVNFKTIGGKGITKKVHDYIDINIGAGKVEKRPVVTFDIEFAGKHWKNVPFSISDRSTNEQQVLIGKDFIIKNGGIIDVRKEYNLGEAVSDNASVDTGLSNDKVKEWANNIANNLLRPKLPRDVIAKLLYTAKTTNKSISALATEFKIDYRTAKNYILRYIPDRQRTGIKQPHALPSLKRDEIIRLYKQGIEAKEISNQTSSSLRTVYDIIGQYGGAMPVEIRNINLGREVVRLSNMGLSSAQISKMLKVSEKTVVRYRGKARKQPDVYGKLYHTPQMVRSKPVPSDISDADLIELVDIELKKKGKKFSFEDFVKNYGVGVDRIKDAFSSELSRLEKQQKKMEGEQKKRFESIEGKKKNRNEEFKVIAPYVKQMDSPITILDLPAEFGYEKDFVNHFNKPLKTFGFEYKNFNKTRQLAQAVKQQYGDNIDIALLKGDINKLSLLDELPGFGGIKPGSSAWFKEQRISPPNQFDIIDLDYTGMPGTNKLNESDHPFKYPVDISKKFLTQNGLLCVTYTAVGLYNSEMYKTTTFKDRNYNLTIKPKIRNMSMGMYPKEKTKNYLFGDNKEAYDTNTNMQNRYFAAARSSNIYLNGIVDYGKANGVTLTPIFTNLYKGSANFIMWRGVFIKK